MKKTKRISILVNIGILFLTAALIALLCIFLISVPYRFYKAAEQSGILAENACQMAKMVLSDHDPDLILYTDEEKREEIHGLLRKLCGINKLLYLYLYTVDENEVRHWVITAAESDELDDLINEEYPFGIESDVPLEETEKKALSGDIDAGYYALKNEYGDVLTWTMPVFDKNGKVTALIAADYDMDYVIEVERKELINSLLAILVVLFTMFCLALYFIRRGVLIPLRTISDKMKGFLKDRNAVLPEHRLPVKNEITDIEDSFKEMAKDINDYLSEIETLTVAQVETRVQMDYARKIQYGIVPPHYSETNEYLSAEGFM